MSATPLDSLLLATANQSGLLTPVGPPDEARGDLFEDHLRDANQVTETKGKPIERESTRSESPPPPAKEASKQRLEDAEANVASVSAVDNVHDTEDQIAQPQGIDQPAAEISQVEEANQSDGEEVAVVVVADTEETVDTSETVVAGNPTLIEPSLIETEATDKPDEREANEEGSSDSGAEPTDEAIASEVIVDETTVDETIQVAEAFLKSEISSSEAKPGLNPTIVASQGESAVEAGSASVVAEASTALLHDAQPIDPASRESAIAGQDSNSILPLQPTDIEPTTPGEENSEVIPGNLQNESKQIAATTAASSNQSEIANIDTATSQDQPRQESSPRRSFGNPKPTEQSADTLEQPTTTAKAEVIKAAAEIIAQIDTPPVEPVANAVAAPTENGRADGLLGGTLGKLQQTARRAVQSTSENGPPNQPRVDSARFVGRVSRAFQIAQDRGGTIQLRLSPPELGSLKLQVTIEQGVLSATIDAETDAARNALLDNLPALRAKLAEQDIRIEKFDVNVGQEGDDAPQEFETRERQQRGNGPTRRASRPGNPEANEQAAASIDITEITAGDNNINLLI